MVNSPLVTRDLPSAGRIAGRSGRVENTRALGAPSPWRGRPPTIGGSRSTLTLHHRRPTPLAKERRGPSDSKPGPAVRAGRRRAPTARRTAGLRGVARARRHRSRGAARRVRRRGRAERLRQNVAAAHRGGPPAAERGRGAGAGRLGRRGAGRQAAGARRADAGAAPLARRAGQHRAAGIGQPCGQRARGRPGGADPVGGPGGLRAGAAARAERRHAAARGAGPRPGRRSRSAAHGRALRRAGRDHARADALRVAPCLVACCRRRRDRQDGAVRDALRHRGRRAGGPGHRAEPAAGADRGGDDDRPPPPAPPDDERAPAFLDAVDRIRALLRTAPPEQGPPDRTPS